MKLITVYSLAILFGLSSFTLAATELTLESALAKCRLETAELKRLACYDAIGQTHSATASTNNTVPAKPNTADTGITLPATTVSAVIENFGKEHRVQPQQEVDQLVATVAAVAITPRKTLVITLENGQTWRQTDSAFLNLAARDTINIRRGTLGAFFLSKEGTNRSIRVRRDD